MWSKAFVSLKEGTEELGQQLVVWQERVRAHVRCPWGFRAGFGLLLPTAAFPRAGEGGMHKMSQFTVRNESLAKWTHTLMLSIWTCNKIAAIRCPHLFPYCIRKVFLCPGTRKRYLRRLVNHLIWMSSNFLVQESGFFGSVLFWEWDVT